MTNTTRIASTDAAARRLFASDKPSATRSMGKNR
jgi:hypothetical protein